LYSFIFSSVRTTCLAHPTFFDLFILLTWRGIYIVKLAIMQFSQFSSFLFLVGPYISIHTLFSNILNLCFSPNVKDKNFTPIRSIGWSCTFLNSYFYWVVAFFLIAIISDCRSRIFGLHSVFVGFCIKSLCVSHDYANKQGLPPYTTVTSWSL
jgi:hypothetical protein